jgi:hypothetical protein
VKITCQDRRFAIIEHYCDFISVLGCLKTGDLGLRYTL